MAHTYVKSCLENLGCLRFICLRKEFSITIATITTTTLIDKHNSLPYSKYYLVQHITVVNNLEFVFIANKKKLV